MAQMPNSDVLKFKLALNLLQHFLTWQKIENLTSYQRTIKLKLRVLQSASTVARITYNVKKMTIISSVLTRF